MKPVIEVLQQRLDEVKDDIQRNRRQQLTLKTAETALLNERYDLQGAIQFLKDRQPPA